MANKTISDLGANAASYTFGRLPNGDPFCNVDIKANDGDIESITISGPDLTSSITGAERTALLSVLGKLYAVALTRAGFA